MQNQEEHKIVNARFEQFGLARTIVGIFSGIVVNLIGTVFGSIAFLADLELSRFARRTFGSFVVSFWVLYLLSIAIATWTGKRKLAVTISGAPLLVFVVGAVMYVVVSQLLATN